MFTYIVLKDNYRNLLMLLSSNSVLNMVNIIFSDKNTKVQDFKDLPRSERQTIYVLVDIDNFMVLIVLLVCSTTYTHKRFCNITVVLVVV